MYSRPEIFERFERLKEQGKIRHLGVSVEKIDEAMQAIEYPNVATIQIIFNMFRQRPAEQFFEAASAKDIGILARVPLASGLLTGTYDRHTHFGPQDHRSNNRNGELFDKGETFSGVDYVSGLQAVKELKQVFPGEENLAPRALQWILQFPEVSCVIPGASRTRQVSSNLSTFDLPAMTEAEFSRVHEIYTQHIKPHVHQYW